MNGSTTGTSRRKATVSRADVTPAQEAAALMLMHDDSYDYTRLGMFPDGVEEFLISQEYAKNKRVNSAFYKPQLTELGRIRLGEVINGG